MASGTARVALYARISEDSTGEGVGVERQLTSGRDLAAARGWNVVEECTDNDISALTGKRRPGYARVLELVRLDAIDHVVVWQTSRLLRNRAERAAAIQLLGEHQVGIITVKGQDLDLSNAYGRGMAGMLGEFDTMESEVKSERVAAAAADRARRGDPNGGLGYGWTKTAEGYVVNEAEATVVRDIVERLGRGESLLGVTADLNRRNVPGPGAGGWGKTSVKKIAMRQSNAALRVHHRGRPTEQVFPGSWPALVSRAQHDKVTAALSAPGRRSNGASRPGARRHLLTWGLGECGVCNGRLRAVTKRPRSGREHRLYVCDGAGCVGRDEAAVDQFVRGVVVARLARPDALDWLLVGEEKAREAQDHLDELQRRLDEAADRYADGRLGGPQLDRITERLRPQIREAERGLGRLLAARDIDAAVAAAGPAAAAKWDDMSLARRRSVLEVLIQRVVIERVTKHGPGFDPTTVRIDWRQP